MEERDYLLFFTACPYVGPAALRRLKQSFGTWQAAWLANGDDLSIAWQPSMIRKFLDWKKNFQPDQCLNDLHQGGIKLIDEQEPDYPVDLRQVYQPPLLLFYRGNLSALKQPCLSAVGSRHPDSYGRHSVDLLLRPISMAGVTLISGLALGIDTAVHQAALANRQPTVAVPGSGLSDFVLYPKANRRLAAEIIEKGGLLLSEFPPDQIALPANFPRRNRLIAGLSQATIIIQAALKSGSLITAKLALDLGKEVLAVPGPITSALSGGTNFLLQNGAHPILSSQDLLDLYQLSTIAQTAADSPVEQLIVDALKQAPSTPDELVNLLNLDIRVITQTVTLMQLKGRLSDYGGGILGINF